MTDPESKAISTTEEKKETDPKTLEKVAERLRFFLSDANLRHDVFLRRILWKDEELLTADTLLKFQTIQKHTTDPEVVLAAAKTMPDFLEVSDETSSIKRVNPFTKDLMDGNRPLSLIVSNLPISEKSGDSKYEVSVEDVKEAFSQYGTITLVKLRFKAPSRKAKRTPSGEALVEFSTEEELKKAAEDTLTVVGEETVEPKRTVSIKGQSEEARTLTVQRLDEYLDTQKKKRKERDEKKEEPAVEPYTIDWKPGCVVRLEGMPDGCDREAIVKAVASCLGKTEDEVTESKVYIDFSRGQKDGAIQFPEAEENVKTVAEKLKSGDVKIGDAVVSAARILDGDEETTYWKDHMDLKTKQKMQRRDDRNRKPKRPRRD